MSLVFTILKKYVFVYSQYYYLNVHSKYSTFNRLITDIIIMNRVDKKKTNYVVIIYFNFKKYMLVSNNFAKSHILDSVEKIQKFNWINSCMSKWMLKLIVLNKNVKTLYFSNVSNKIARVAIPM